MNREGNSSRMGFLLAGGKSSRMGVDKAFLKFDGRSLLERGVEALHRVCPVVAIVGEASKFSNCGVAVVEDIYRNCGPLGGIHAALTHAPAELNLMLAVDM